MTQTEIFKRRPNRRGPRPPVDEARPERGGATGLASSGTTPRGVAAIEPAPVDAAGAIGKRASYEQRNDEEGDCTCVQRRTVSDS
jgi:hypothetical protein